MQDAEQPNKDQNNTETPLDGKPQDSLPKTPESVTASFNAKRRQDIQKVNDPVSPEKAQETTDQGVSPEIKKEKPQPEPQADLEKLKSLYLENQKYSRATNQKLKEAEKKIREWMASDDIATEQATLLLETLKSDALKMPEEESFSTSHKESKQDKFSELYAVVTQDMMRQYVDVSEDDRVGEKMHAFDVMIGDASEEEKEKVFTELSACKDAPLALLKKILKLGEDYLASDYGEVFKQGTIKKYVDTKKTQVSKLEKEVEHLKKRLSQYEDFEGEGHIDLRDTRTSGSKSAGQNFYGSATQKFERERREAAQRR